MTSAKGNLEVVLDKRGLLKLKPGDYKATGGEGSIYVASATVIKIYTDTGKMQRENIPDKIELLAKIQHPCIVAPQGLVRSPSGEPIGYYMDFADAEPLPRVFTGDFQQSHGFGKDEASKLVEGMRGVVSTAHEYQAVMVDANEMNWLVDLKQKSKPEPKAIDVDSWAIGKWPATVIMLSIRDWHSKTFDQLTDWFAWGVVTFQVYAGIHPYKGTLDGFKRGDIVSRMKANASVFAPGVKLNNAVRDFNVIPGQLLDWYRATFQDGLRAKPPSPYATGLATVVVQKHRAQITASGVLVYDKLFEDLTNAALKVFHCGAVLLKSGDVIDLSSKKKPFKNADTDCEIIKTDHGWVRGEVKANVGKFFFSDGEKEKELPLELTTRKLVRYENRLFAVTEKGLSELVLHHFGRPVLSLGNTWGAMINSTNWFDGVGVQDAFGATFVITPFSTNSCIQLRVKELDGWSVITAKSGYRFISLIAINNQGQYRKFELTLDERYDNYKLWQGDVDSAEHNLAILPRGVVASILNDGELCIFVPLNGSIKKVADKFISTDMQLSTWDQKVIYLKDGAVWSVKMS